MRLIIDRLRDKMVFVEALTDLCFVYANITANVKVHKTVFEF